MNTKKLISKSQSGNQLTDEQKKEAYNKASEPQKRLLRKRIGVSGKENKSQNNPPHLEAEKIKYDRDPTITFVIANSKRSLR